MRWLYRFIGARLLFIACHRHVRIFTSEEVYPLRLLGTWLANLYVRPHSSHSQLSTNPNATDAKQTGVFFLMRLSMTKPVVLVAKKLSEECRDASLVDFYTTAEI